MRRRTMTNERATTLRYVSWNFECFLQLTTPLINGGEVGSFWLSAKFGEDAEAVRTGGGEGGGERCTMHTQVKRRSRTSVGDDGGGGGSEFPYSMDRSIDRSRRAIGGGRAGD